MSVERHHPSAERHEQADSQLEAARAERLAELHKTAETDPANHSERRAEAAREAIAAHEAAPEPAAAAESAPASPSRHLLDYRLAFAQTMAGLQRRLKPVSRNFSRFIHIPVVEKTAEALEQTIARPSVTLGATWTALIIGGIFYLTARHYGYPLSGSELLFAFVIGAILGIAGEGLWRALRRR